MKTTNLLTTIIFVFSFLILHAQDSKLPTAGFDTTNQYHPVFIQSNDGKYKLNIGLYTQFRYNTNLRFDLPDQLPDSSRSWTNGYSMARTRIFLEGDFTDKIYYHIRMNINATSNMELFVAYLQWNIKNNMKLRAGKQFMALGREDWMYPENLASMEFSANDFTYAIWNSFGFQFHHQVNDKFRYWASIGNGVYGGRKPYPAPETSDIMLTARAEFQLMGTNWGIWDDMLGRKGQDFGMLLGAGAAYNHRSDTLTIADYSENGYQINVDYSVSGNGYQLFTQGSMTSRTYNDGLLDNTVYGFYGTFGYWFTKKVFGYTRYDLVLKGDHKLASENYASPGLGVSYYPFTWTNRVRISLEYNHLNAKINNTLVVPDGSLGLVESSYGGQQSIRFQLQFGF